MYDRYTEGMEVTVITRKTMGTNTFKHCLVTRVSKSCVWAGEQRWKFDGTPWGSGPGARHLSSPYAELATREVGLRRERDHLRAQEQGTYAKRYRDLVNVLAQHRPYSKHYREGQDAPPEIIAVARELLTMLETGELP